MTLNQHLRKNLISMSFISKPERAGRMSLFVAAGIAMSSGLFVSPAAADETRIDATASLYGFSSPTNENGPWKIGDLRYVNQKGGQAINVELARRIDKGRFTPAKGTYAAVGYTVDLTDHLSAFAQVGVGSSAPFARSTQHVELGYKVFADKRLVLAISEDWARFTGGARLRQTSIGPTMYLANGVLQVRAIVQANTGVRTRTGGLVSYDYIVSPSDKVSAGVQFGAQSYGAVSPGLPTTLAGLTGTTATLTLEHMISHETGVSIGGLYSRLTNRVTGGRAYTERGVTLGYFIKH